MKTTHVQPDRREFLNHATAVGVGACCLPVFDFTAWATEDVDASALRAVDYCQSLDGGRVQCFVCPLNCTLSDGQTCFCRTRTNVGGRLVTRAYANPCVVRIEPIEKTPLYHFLPGQSCLTVGVGGCNLRCIYCQNWEVSQSLPQEVEKFTLQPQEIVEAARQRGVGTIAFNITEPVAFLEYATDIARAAKANGLRVICATAGFVNPEPLLAFAAHVDAFCVTLKGFSEAFYLNNMGIPFAPIQAALKTIRRDTGAWLEIAHLMVPHLHEDMDEFRRMCVWIRDELGGQTPLHLARFTPAHKISDYPQTDVQALADARQIALKTGLAYVYLANVASHPGCNTYCPRCRRALIDRAGFDVLRDALRKNACPACQATVAGVWE